MHSPISVGSALEPIRHAQRKPIARIGDERPHVVRQRPAAAFIAHGALAVYLIAAAWLALGAARGSYLAQLPGRDYPDWILGPLRSLAIEPRGIGATSLSVTLLVMLAAYALELAFVRSLSSRGAWMAIVVTNLLFCLTPLFFSSDAFGYLSYARLGVLHGLNPYLFPPAAAAHDAVFRYVYWRAATSPYGPLFTLASYPLALLSPAAAMWTLRCVGAAASVWLAWVVSRAADARGRNPVAAAVLVGLNPVLLFYAVTGTHNDLEATLLVATGLLFALRRHEGRSATAFVAAAAIKLTAGIALPFVVLGARRRWSMLRACLLAGALAVTGTLVLFGPHVLGEIQRISSDARYNIAYTGPDRLATLLGTTITPTLRRGCLLAAGVVALVGLWRVRRGGDWISAAGWTTLALIVALASAGPWYLVWVLPFAALSRGRTLRIATFALTAYVLAVHLPLLGGVPLIHPPAS
jgi:hypothetical protein